VAVYVPRCVQNGSESLGLKTLEDFDFEIEGCAPYGFECCFVWEGFVFGASVPLSGFFSHSFVYVAYYNIRISLSKPSIKFGYNNEMTAVEIRSFGLR
jgi:hypothetical protein